MCKIYIYVISLQHKFSSYEILSKVLSLKCEVFGNKSSYLIAKEKFMIVYMTINFYPVFILLSKE